MSEKHIPDLVKPSTSLFGSIHSIISYGLMCIGRGLWTMIPLIFSFCGSSLTAFSSSFWVIVFSNLYTQNPIPTSRARFSFIRIYERLAGLSPTSTTASIGFSVVVEKLIPFFIFSSITEETIRQSRIILSQIRDIYFRNRV